MSRRRAPEELRSFRWFGPETLRGFGHRSRMKQMGYTIDEFRGRPAIGILNTWSDINCCHSHFRERAEQVRRGVLEAGGFPLEIPLLSLAEQFQKPSTMMYRNLLALETEEVMRSYPLDGAVLMGGCDKTTPALIMGAISADLPVVFLPAGPMLRGNWRGAILGSGTDAWKHWDEKRAGLIDEATWSELEDGIARSAGHCMTMGTASTMTAAAEALGLTLAGASSIPAVDANHIRMAVACGRRAVELAWEDVKPSDILDERSFDNSVRTVLALGGSTNAVIHLVAMARRAGVGLDLDRFDTLSRDTPVLADLRPAGRFLMEDFYYAGGLRGLLSRLEGLLELDARTVNGATIGESLRGASVWNDEVIRPLENPVSHEGGLAILRGSLAPNGAVIKPVAAEGHLLEHEGSAIVFDDYDELEARIDRDDLDVTPSSVLVLRNAGPVGGPGMPEWGMLPTPEEAPCPGTARHGAHLGRTHEWHELRHVRPARLARSSRRRPPRPRRGRRPHRARRRGPPPRPVGRRRRARPPARGASSAGAEVCERVRQALLGARDPGGARLRLRLLACRRAYSRARDPLRSS